MFIHDTKEAAAAAIDADDGPSHDVVRSETTDPYEVAAKYRLSANASQAMEAANIGPAPGPVYISPELTSGGRAPYSSIYEAP